MRVEVYSVQDAAVGAFLPPFFARSRGEAIRSFEQAATDSARFAPHAKDYSLWFLSVFEDSTGVFDVVQPERVCGALDFARPTDT